MTGTKKSKKPSKKTKTLAARSVDANKQKAVRGGATAAVGKANFDVFTVSKNIDTSTTQLIKT